MDNSYEHLKLCAARYVYRKKQFGLVNFYAWREWWEKKFNDSFYDYIEKKRAEKVGEGVNKPAQSYST